MIYRCYNTKFKELPRLAVGWRDGERTISTGKRYSMVILLTGANRGLGRAIAEQALLRGVDLIGVVRNEDAARQAEDLVAKGMRLFVTDLSVPDAAAALAGSLQKAQLQPSTLILNAGVMDEDCSDLLDENAMRRIMEVNLIGPLSLLSHLLPILKSCGGCAIGISSLSARLATDEGRVAYPASKAGLSMAFSALRLQRRFDPVRFITVEPGSMTPQPRALGVVYDQAASRILDAAESDNPSEVITFPISMALVYKVLGLLPTSLLQWISNRRQSALK